MSAMHALNGYHEVDETPISALLTGCCSCSSLDGPHFTLQVGTVGPHDPLAPISAAHSETVAHTMLLSIDAM